MSTTSPTIAALLKQVKPAQASVRLCLRGDLLGEVDLIKDELAQYDGWKPDALSDADPRKQLTERLALLEGQMREASATFTFASVGDKAWSDLLAAHPPREGKEETFDPTSFPIAAIAASSVAPKMTADDVRELFDVFNLSQRNTIFNATFAANVRAVDIPFSSASSGVEADTEKK